MSLKCPFCGASQRKIPVDMMRVRCKYCGGMIVIPRSMKIDIQQCCNHPERAASETCNDCHQYFCNLCLQTYELKTRTDESILVYLCPHCLRKRVLKEANGCIYGGSFFLLMGISFAVLFLPHILAFGLLCLAMFALPGAALVIYGFSQRGEAAKKTSVVEPQAEEEKTEEPSLALQGGEIDELYGKLLAYYSTRYGPETAKRWLDLDIWAYTRRGATFSEAVNRIYRQEEKSIKCGDSKKQR